jgi:hypothetical protein
MKNSNPLLPPPRSSVLLFRFKMEGGGIFHRTMTRVAFFTGGATVCYAFSNPDEGNVYDIFPTARTKYAFISRFQIDASDRWKFENKWKDLARFYQAQEGYLFNKLVRASGADDGEEGKLDYYALMQWTTGESFLKSTQKSNHKLLVDELPVRRMDKPIMYKVVVDDTEFDPNESFAPYNNRQ